MHFAREGELVQAYSAPKTITPKAYLTAPTKPRKVYAGRSFTSHGYLTPRHSTGSQVRRHQVLQMEFLGSAGTSTITLSGRRTRPLLDNQHRYYRRVRLPHKGKWKLVARTWGGTDHATTYSAPRYLTVR